MTLLIGAQRPRLYTAPDRHRAKNDNCPSCGNYTDPAYANVGCGDYVSQDILDWAKGVGYKLDDWQQWVIREGCGVRPDRHWSSFENTLIVSRQNGKGAILEVRELAGLFVLRESLIIHTAHELKTAQEHFRRVVATIDQYPALSRRMKGKPRASHGEEAIELLVSPTVIFGAGRKMVKEPVAPRLRFLARSRGSARGFTCDCLVYDEAMILSVESVGASLPALSARPNSQMWLTGSAGLEDSDQLARSRRRIVRNSKDLFGAEWSIVPHLPTCPRDRARGRATNDFVVDCFEHDDRDIPHSWAKANPAYGIRLNEDFTRNEMAILSSVEFDRERNGVGQWPEEEEPWKIIAEDLWKSLSEPEPGKIQPRTQIAFALDVDEDGASATIAAAWGHPQGFLVIEVPRNCSRVGTNWVIPRLTELVSKYRPIAIVAPRTGPAAGLGDDLEKLWPKHHKFGSKLIRPGPADEAAGFAWFVQQCKDEHRPLRHLGQERAGGLWHAVGSAEVRVVGDGGKTWSRRDSTTDITPATACNLAAWGYNRKRRDYDPVKGVA